MEALRRLITDKTTLLLAFVGLLFVGFNILLVILQIDRTQAVAITRYNLIASPPFSRGNTSALYVFAIAPAVFYLIQFVFAARTHARHRGLSILILSLGIVVMLFSVAVSSAIINVNK